MGRPKGSKNKPKVVVGTGGMVLEHPMTATDAEIDKAVQDRVNPKRTRKPTKSRELEKSVRFAEHYANRESEPTDKATLLKQMQAPISPQEAAQLVKQAREEQAKVTDPQSVVNRAIEEVIKPNWQQTSQDGAGLKHFLVNAQRHGETVSMDKEKWDFGLKQAGLRGQLTASKPEAGQDLEAKTVNRWRVMIG